MEKVNDVELLGTHTLNTSAQGAATGEVTEHPVSTACGTADAGFLRDGPGVVAAPCHLAKHNLKLNLRLNNSFNLNLSSIMPTPSSRGCGALCFPTHDPGGVPGVRHVACGAAEE